MFLYQLSLAVYGLVSALLVRSPSYSLVVPGDRNQLPGATCLANGLRFQSRTTAAQILCVQGRWSLRTTKVYLTLAGLSSAGVWQLCAYFPVFPVGCLLVWMNGRVFPYPATGSFSVPGDTTEIRLFYNIWPFLLPFVTPHLLVHVVAAPCFAA